MAIAAVRPAAASDVEEIVRIQATTWEAAYAELVPAAAMAQLRSPDARQAWAAAVASGPDHHVLVATEGDWTVGFCAAAPARSPAVPEATAARQNGSGQVTGNDAGAEPGIGPEHWAEIGALLVEPRWGRRGHGGRLLAAAAEAMRETGALYGLAWIPEADTASRRFYARVGWQPDGTVRVLDTGDGMLREIRFTGSLDLELQP